MGLFSKRGPGSSVPPDILEQLAPFGAAALDSRSGRPISERFGWHFVEPIVTGARGPDRDRILQALYDTAYSDQERGPSMFGAYSLLSEADCFEGDELFSELRDAALEYMHSLGLSSGHLTRSEADRWIEQHGDLRSSFDHVVDDAAPAPGEGPLAWDLDAGESLLVALTEPLPEGNEWFVERGVHGRYKIFSVRPRSSDDLTRSRYAEDHLGEFADVREALTVLGSMFGTPTYWASDELQPYFPHRRIRNS